MYDSTAYGIKMPRHFIQTIFVAVGISFLLLFSCCKQPIQPEEPKLNFNEPDTIKSLIKFTLRSPLRHVFNWNVQTPSDTFSIGAITSTGVIMRPALWRSGEVIFTHAIKSNFCSLHCSFSSNLLTQDFLRPDNTLDAVRSWQTASLSIFFRVPKIIQTPIKIDNTTSDSTFDISFSDKRYQERFVYGTTPTSWKILSFVSDIFADVQYSPRYLNSIDTLNYDPLSLRPYRTRLEQAEIIIERYDTIRQRVNGRFSFRMMGYDNTIVEVRDGLFDNVLLTRQNE
jgi:hypothetical protein